MYAVSEFYKYWRSAGVGHGCREMVTARRAFIHAWDIAEREGEKKAIAKIALAMGMSCEEVQEKIDHFIQAIGGEKC